MRTSDPKSNSRKKSGINGIVGYTPLLRGFQLSHYLSHYPTNKISGIQSGIATGHGRLSAIPLSHLSH